MSDISLRSTYFTSQYSRNRLIRDLFTGLDAMRGSSLIENTANASTVYLPQFPNEPMAVYNLRVRRSYLTNYFLRAIDSDSGKVLAKSIGIKVNGDQDAPEQFDPWLDDTDLEGKPFSVMARDQLQDALGKGISLTYVDYIGARPFVREIDVDNVLSFRADQATGRLTFLRWQDSCAVGAQCSMELVVLRLASWCPSLR
jgi:hypothetical protein